MARTISGKDITLSTQDEPFFKSHTTTDLRAKCTPEFLARTAKRRVKNKLAKASRKRNRNA